MKILSLELHIVYFHTSRDVLYLLFKGIFIFFTQHAKSKKSDK